jgi:ATP-dependent helicase HrpA
LSIAHRIKSIESRLSGVPLKDRQRLLRELRSVRRAAASEESHKESSQTLDRMEETLSRLVARKARRVALRAALTYPDQLPICSKRHDIVEAIRENRVVIISGETGCGKSTQIPKMCLEAGRGLDGKIGCTQPRRIAAIAVARRIAEELGESPGNSVGYKIRFTEKSSPEGYIKVMTDGILLAETHQDRFLYEYDTIMIDEAHERSLNIDFLLGLLKSLLSKREDLNLIITSATFDTRKFSAAFDGAPVIDVEGRTYPVDVRYVGGGEDGEDAEATYVERAVEETEGLVRKGRPGDILIFMPTEQDIRDTCELLEGRRFDMTVVLPLFARLTGAEQQRVFSPFPGRKIVVATNVAETSLTIPGIRYVIDTGLARIPRYLTGTRTTSLAVVPISKSSADQRKGRCGRVTHGICLRLYSEATYESSEEFTVPEILRSNLGDVILRMMALGLGRVESFPFVDKPHPKAIRDGYVLLLELGALEKEGKDYRLTPTGRKMARIPLDPRVSRMLIEAAKQGVLGDMVVICAALSIQDPRERPLERAEEADRAHGLFKDPDSDFLTLLNIWTRFERTGEIQKTQNRLRRFSRDHFLSYVRMREWRDVHQQITDILKEQGIKGEAAVPPSPQARYEAIHRSVLAGCLSNIAQKKEKNIFLAARGREVMIFPGSTLFNREASWIVANEVVRTSRTFARTAARIDPAWLVEMGKGLCKSSYSDPHWSRARGEVLAYEQVTLFGLVIVPKRPVSYGSIDPGAAHEIFVRSALIRGEVKETFPFLKHNLGLVQKVTRLEDKIRRRDLLVDEHVTAEFYSSRLPNVWDIRALKRRIRENGDEGFLKMREEDLLSYSPDERLLESFPDRIDTGDRTYAVAYRFAPGQEEDGMTVAVPSTLASVFPVESLDWMVPGLFKEKIAAMVKALPKRYRRQLVPVSNVVETIWAEMERGGQPLATRLSDFLHRRFNVDVPAGQWDRVEIPDHLKTRVAVTDHRGHELRSGRDGRILKDLRTAGDPPEVDSKIWQEAKARWERTGTSSWDFDSIPERISLSATMVAYPALVPGERCVSLRLFSNGDEAAETHKEGVKTLLSIALSKELKFIRRWLGLPPEARDGAAYFGGVDAFEKTFHESLRHRLLHRDIRDREAFENYAEAMRTGLTAEAESLMEHAVRVLRAFHQTRLTVYTIETANPANRPVMALMKGIREDLTTLVPGDFLRAYPLDRMGHVVRYLRAMEIRAERGANDPDRDRRKELEAAVFVEALRRMEATDSPHLTSEKKEATETFRWMVEEFKVSLFAQELKTPFPVSRKRLDQKMKEIERMV